MLTNTWIVEGGAEIGLIYLCPGVNVQVAQVKKIKQQKTHVVVCGSRAQRHKQALQA